MYIIIIIKERKIEEKEKGKKIVGGVGGWVGGNHGENNGITTHI